MIRFSTFHSRVLRCALGLTIAVLVSACSRPGEPAAGGAAAPAVAGDRAQASRPAITPEPPPPPRTPGPVVPPQGPEPVRGKDYEEIANGAPFEAVPGKIEVVEVFGYVCPACARFAPLVEPWHRKLPEDVHFTYVPAPFGPEWDPYAKAYFAAQSLGLVDRTHMALINAIHANNTMPGEGDKPDPQAIADFYAAYGANPKQFLDLMNSFAVATKVNRGKQFMQRSGVTGTPTMVVNGKYRVTGGESYDDVLRITEHLIARERAAMSGAATTPATAPASGAGG